MIKFIVLKNLLHYITLKVLGVLTLFVLSPILFIIFLLGIISTYIRAEEIDELV